MIKRFNNFLAKHITLALGTMWAFYVFLLYSLLPMAFPKAMEQLMYWSNVIQLITLLFLPWEQAFLVKVKKREQSRIIEP